MGRIARRKGSSTCGNSTFDVVFDGWAWPRMGCLVAVAAAGCGARLVAVARQATEALLAVAAAGHAPDTTPAAQPLESGWP